MVGTAWCAHFPLNKHLYRLFVQVEYDPGSSTTNTDRHHQCTIECNVQEEKVYVAERAIAQRSLSGSKNLSDLSALAEYFTPTNSHFVRRLLDQIQKTGRTTS